MSFAAMFSSGIINEGEYNHHGNERYQQFKKKINIHHMF